MSQEPREFWIPRDYQCDFRSGIHVIEKSAYDVLQGEVMGHEVIMKDQIAEINTLKSDLEACRVQSEERWANLHEREAKINELKDELAALKAELRLVRAGKNGFSDMADDLTAERDALKAERDEYKFAKEHNDAICNEYKIFWDIAEQRVTAYRDQCEKLAGAFVYSLRGLQMWRTYQSPGNIAEVEQTLREAIAKHAEFKEKMK